MSICSLLNTPVNGLDRWLRFHRAVGVEHFLLLVPADDNAVKQNLERLRIHANVTVESFDPRLPREHVLTGAILGLQRQTRWVALLDASDLLLPLESEDLRAVLAELETYGGVVANRVGEEAPTDESLEPEEEGNSSPETAEPGADRKRRRLRGEPCIVVNPMVFRKVDSDQTVKLRSGLDYVDGQGVIGGERPWNQNDVDRLCVLRYPAARGGQATVETCIAPPLPERVSALLEGFSGGEDSGEEVSRRSKPGPMRGIRSVSRAFDLARAEARLHRHRRRELSMALMFKDASPYLVEWLEFHRLVGVEHFYLYDHASTDEPQRLLQPYVAAGLVTLRKWPRESDQKSCFDHAIHQAAAETRWLAIIDDDEFLFPAEGFSLRTLIRSYERFAGVTVPWLMFGSSGHRNKPEGLVTENFTYRANALHPLRKCIVDPARVSEFVSVHHFRYQGGHTAVDEYGYPSPGGISRRRSADRFRLHHYYTKSYEEAKRKIERRGYVNPDSETYEQTQNYLRAALEDGLNEIEDRTLDRFLPALRRAVINPAGPLPRE